MNVHFIRPMRPAFDRNTIGAAGLAAWLATQGALVIAYYASGSWPISIGAMIVTWIPLNLVAGLLARHLSMPRASWNLIVRHCPPRGRVTDDELECIGRGSLDDHPLMFVVVADNEALTVRIFGDPLLRRKTAAIPWAYVDIKEVGLSENDEPLAVLSIKEPMGCELVLPWHPKFSACREGSWRKPQKLIDLVPEGQSYEFAVPVDHRIVRPTTAALNRKLTRLSNLPVWVAPPIAFVITMEVMGSWAISVGVMIAVGLLAQLIAALVTIYLSMPRLWNHIVRRFPPRHQVTFENMDCLGHGCLNGYPLALALIADDEALTTKISSIPTLRSQTATIPWSHIECNAIGLDESGEHLALLSIKEPIEFEFVLPWKKRFSEYLKSV